MGKQEAGLHTAHVDALVEDKLADMQRTSKNTGLFLHPSFRCGTNERAAGCVRTRSSTTQLLDAAIWEPIQRNGLSVWAREHTNGFPALIS